MMLLGLMSWWMTFCRCRSASAVAILPAMIRASSYGIGSSLMRL